MRFSGSRLRQIFLAYLFLLPTLIILSVFLFYPMLRAFLLSLWDYSPLSPDNKFVGLDNFIRLSKDADFWRSLGNSFLYLIVVPIIIILSLALALLAVVIWNVSTQVLAQWGIAHRLYDPMDVAGLQAMISERTRLVWLEAPGSITMEFPDLRALARAARQRGVPTALDNTWGGGLALKAFDLGEGAAVDLSMHALTKYPSGGSDVLMGSVVTRDAALHEKLLLAHMRLGIGVAANDVEMVLRSLPTLEVRYRAHDASARRIAASNTITLWPACTVRTPTAPRRI